MARFARPGRALAAIGAVVLGSLVLSAPQSFAADPAGNNGTVKIDGVEFDQTPDNQPHVGCVFEVDFYGYDEGDLYARVTFFAIPPTTDGGAKVKLVSKRVFIGEDSNDGGGSIDGLDQETEFDLSSYLQSFMADNQGYHIKLLVNADGSQGADKKHKVFFVEECAYGSAA